MKKWDERLADLSTDLARLSEKAADASEDAKTARELRQEAIERKKEREALVAQRIAEMEAFESDLRKNTENKAQEKKEEK